MKLSEFINVYSFAQLKKRDAMSLKQMQEEYFRNFLLIPRIYCNDGFNVSVQIKYGSYCESENKCQFGLEWKTVEWGYPSEPMDERKYNPEDSSGRSVGCFVPIETMDELIEQHGGLDLKTTLENSLVN